MPESRHDYGPVRRIEAEAFGEPGQRTFRVFAANESEGAALWLEKEQLRALGRAIEEQLSRLKGPRGQADASASVGEPALGGNPALDFRVGQMALGFDERQSLFLLLVYAVDDDEEGRPTFSCQATAAQLRTLAERIEEVVNAGRPPCPLCGEPIDRSGHACIRTNGHRSQPLPPLTAEDDEDE